MDYPFVQLCFIQLLGGPAESNCIAPPPHNRNHNIMQSIFRPAARETRFVPGEKFRAAPVG